MAHGPKPQRLSRSGASRVRAAGRDDDDAQLKSQKATKATMPDRAFHARSIVAFTGCRCRLRDDLPANLHVGFAQPGRPIRPRSLLKCLFDTAGRQQEGLPRSGGSRSRFREGAARSSRHQLPGVACPRCPAVRLLRPRACRRLAVAGRRLVRSDRPVRPVGDDPHAAERPSGQAVSRSLALETYWSRGAMSGADNAVRFIFAPRAGCGAEPGERSPDPTFLEAEFVDRLRKGDVRLRASASSAMSMIRLRRSRTPRWSGRERPPRPSRSHG